MSPATLFVIFTANLLIIITSHTCNGGTTSRFTAVLAFGDSTVDTGNNNYILTTFKGNHPPYGLRFPGNIPTGRFSDGKLVPDMLASLLGLKEVVPPFLQPNLPDGEMVTGVSFASAGSGFDGLTTSFTNVMGMAKQMGLLKDYMGRVESMVGEKEREEILGGALVILSAGTNDFIFNFYDVPTRRLQFSSDKYQDFLQNELQNMVQELYHLGCRRMLITGLPPIGCLPIQMTAKSPLLRACSHLQNKDAQSYNTKLKKLLPLLARDLPGSKILYADVYNPIMYMIQNPQKYGFVETRRGCCGSGLLEAGPLCNPLTPVCKNPSSFLFWDSIHPGESTYRLLSMNLTGQFLHIL